MQSGPGYQGHLWPGTSLGTSLSEPPSSPYNFLRAVASIDSRISLFQTFTFQRNAPVRRLHLGAFFCCAQL